VFSNNNNAISNSLPALETRLTSILGVFGDLYAIMSALHTRSIGQGTPEGVLTLERKMNSLVIITQHLEMLIWVLQNSAVLFRHFTPEAAEQLASTANFRRHARATQFNKNNFVVNKLMQRELMPEEPERAGMLFIDMLLSSINEAADAALPLLGAEPVGLYPDASDMDLDDGPWSRPQGRAAHEPAMLAAYSPLSLDAALDMFLTPSFADNPLKKRCVMLYFFTDLLESPRSDKVVWEKLIGKFCQQFTIPESLQLSTRGFWCLDAQQFTVRII
jgi:hypothetical protein